MLTAEQLSARIDLEIGNNWSQRNGHNCNLKQCLLAVPALQQFESSSDPTKTIDLWLILEEDPVNRDGYKVVYDESTNKFGLACKFISGRNGYLGAYGGTFLEAFDAM